MPAPAEKQTKQTIREAKPTGEPVNVEAGFDRVMKRYPKIMARLAK